MTANDDIKELVNEIISKSDFTLPVTINYQPGSQVGDGFASKNLAVDINNGVKSLHLFVKYALQFQTYQKLHVDAMNAFYANETYFYDVAYPAYKDFLSVRNNKNSFSNVPKCYGTSVKNIIVLENLKKRNYVLYDKSKCMNEAHLTLLMKIFARFHAISFSFKDQNASKYYELVKGTYDSFSMNSKDFGFDRMIGASAKEFLSKLDPINDKYILDGCTDLVDKILHAFSNVAKMLDDYSIITQGDCWVNNMMFLYEDNNKEDPKDVMLVDWQLLRPASPVFDISYFFYTIASKENMKNYLNYLKIYHDELSDQIRQLGSDPDILYPYSVLEKEWRKYGKYGFAMAFIVLKVMLYSKEELPDFEKVTSEQMHEHPELLFPPMKNDDEYIKRLKDIAEHLIENDLL